MQILRLIQGVLALLSGFLMINNFDKCLPICYEQIIKIDNE